jgi:hypothetical protein
MKELIRHLSGSKAYGTSTPESDTDIRGIFAAEKEQIITPFFPVKQQTIEDEEDTELWELHHYMNSYVTKANPNMIETLWIDESDILFCTDEYKYLRSFNEQLLSKKVAFTYSGYAVAQLKRIKGHNKWINNPQPKEAPKHKDFLKMVQNFTDEKIMPRDFTFNSFKNKNIVHYGGDIFGVVDKGGNSAITESGDFNISVKQLSDSSSQESPLFIFKYLKDEYLRAKDNHHNYWQWKNNRNEKRSVLEEKYGYDCYLEEETEFLTEKGFKRYADIQDDELLATIDLESGFLCYEGIEDRVSKQYSGKMYSFENQNSSFIVTPNHRVLTSLCHRNKKTNFSTKYDKTLSDWKYETAEEVSSSYRTHRHVYHSFGEDFSIPDNKEFSDDFLKLVACWVSDGSFIKYDKGGCPKGLTISQLEEGRLQPILESIEEYKVNKNSHFRKGRYENSFNVYGKQLAERVKTLCGEYSRGKRLGPWIDTLSSRQANLFLDTLILGDGTFKKHSRIFYTMSKQLADDVMKLALICGKTTKLWDYSDKGWAYQVHISDKPNVGHLTTREHMKTIEVEDKEVVCFTVPNSNLVTRRNGKIAIQGNCKHAMHLVRLLRQGEEILKGQGVIVKRPDAKELLEIRNGAWEYDDLVKWAEEKDQYIRTELYNKSSLPKTPDLKFAANVLMTAQEMIWNN